MNHLDLVDADGMWFAPLNYRGKSSSLIPICIPSFYLTVIPIAFINIKMFIAKFATKTITKFLVEFATNLQSKTVKQAYFLPKIVQLLPSAGSLPKLES